MKPNRPPLVIGCGALAPELVELTRRAGLPAMDLSCLPASLHNRPEQIPGAVAARIREARRAGYHRIFVAYADCGTGGLLDRMLETEPAAKGVARLEGAHCYEVYAGRAAFAALSDEEPGTFYLTDYLVRNFDRLVVRGLGLDRHPELLPIYFGNYRRLVYLAQLDDADLAVRAEGAAARLGLTFERRLVGLGELATSIAAFALEQVQLPARAPEPVITPNRERAAIRPWPLRGITPSHQIDQLITHTNETARTKADRSALTTPGNRAAGRGAAQTDAARLDAARAGSSRAA